MMQDEARTGHDGDREEDDDEAGQVAREKPQTELGASRGPGSAEVEAEAEAEAEAETDARADAEARQPGVSAGASGL